VDRPLWGYRARGALAVCSKGELFKHVAFLAVKEEKVGQWTLDEVGIDKADCVEFFTDGKSDKESRNDHAHNGLVTMMGNYHGANVKGICVVDVWLCVACDQVLVNIVIESVAGGILFSGRQVGKGGTGARGRVGRAREETPWRVGIESVTWGVKVIFEGRNGGIVDNVAHELSGVAFG